MSQEIGTAHFTPADLVAFKARLRAETDLLATWMAAGVLATGPRTGGYELEGWLVGPDLRPQPRAGELLARLGDPQVIHEVATFNLEINGQPQVLQGRALSQMAAELAATWARAQAVATPLEARLVMIGILPTLREADLILANMTPSNRFPILNAQILAQQQGQPLRLQIQGRDRLAISRSDVMATATTTSFQIHLKVSPAESARVYNLSKIVSAPLVAVSANSPYLFGLDLWRETRIPVYEQTTSVAWPSRTDRTRFGTRYAEGSVLGCFEANLRDFPVYLPELLDEPVESLAHLRLHNGSIWRWNRPVVGFDADGTPHLRIEHRPLAAGPTILDVVANAAFYFGVIHALLQDPQPPEASLPCPVASANFYRAAQQGLPARLQWWGGRVATAREIIADDLLPRARWGLAHLGFDREEIACWLGILADRVRTGQTGAAWQRAYIARHGPDLTALTGAYLERQQSGRPVHAWTL
ncbi:MAG: glutamate--cysteine ligase [Chromatiaceae bacterium]|nr:glutamate--cysteine ligase [Chromatiaceae bacterium]